MLQIFLITFITLVAPVIPKEDGDYIVDIYRDVCPYTATCLKPAKEKFVEIIEMSRPCCFACSCDADCWIAGRCCPDADFIRNGSVLTDAQLYMRGTCLEPGFNIPSSLSFNMYYTIDYCPESYKGTFLEALCIYEDASQLTQLQTVSDGNGVIYRNEYCAKCNGVHGYTKWLMKLRCKGSFYPYPEVTIEGLKATECYVWSEPPNAIQVKNRKCYKSMLPATCNISNAENENNTILKTACEIGQYGLYYGSPMALYKNVFCRLCNLRNGSSNLNKVCSNFNIVKTFSRKPFTSLIKMRVDEMELTDAARIHECGDGEIYDEYQGVCRDLKCPMFSYPRSGRCEDLFDQIDGVVIQFDVKLSLTKIKHNVGNRASQKISIGRNESISIALEIERMVLWYNDNCTVCNVDVKNVDYFEPSDILLTTVIESSINCTLVDIKRMFNNFDDLKMNISIDQTTLMFSAETVLEKVHENQTNDMHFVDINRCRVPPDMDLLDYKCPRIDISGYEYINIAKRTPLTKLDKSLHYDLDTYNDTMLKALSLEVCLDEYFNIASYSEFKHFNFLTTFTMLIASVLSD